MPESYLAIQSISALHELYRIGKPRHPLVSVIDLAENRFKRPDGNVFYRLGFYSVFCKKFSGNLRYGRSHYDFSEGSLIFIAPGQVAAHTTATAPEEGWGLFFHPDLLHGSVLGNKIHTYSFFKYEANEALHISEEEKLILMELVRNIERENHHGIDQHTQGLFQSNIELLLNYATRFYQRQFYTRSKVSTDSGDDLIEKGFPQVGNFASRLNLSSNYLSDLLQRFTGKTTQEHIHLAVIEHAKNQLLGSGKSISEVAYSLGYDHPSHFTRLFKSKTGYSPSEYRSLN